MEALMTKPSLFQLGDVITGEPHLYVANPPSPTGFLESWQIAEPVTTNPLKRFTAAVRRTFRLGPTPGDTLAAGRDRAFMR
jgi:hypothetical protein